MGEEQRAALWFCLLGALSEKVEASRVCVCRCFLVWVSVQVHVCGGMCVAMSGSVSGCVFFLCVHV